HDRVVRGRIEELRPRLPRVVRDVHDEPLELEVELEAGGEMLFVLDHEEASRLLFAHPSFSCVSPRTTAKGKRTRIVVPLPRPSDSASMEPPRLRTSCFTTKRPSPVPRRLRTSASSTR